MGVGLDRTAVVVRPVGQHDEAAFEVLDGIAPKYLGALDDSGAFEVETHDVRRLHLRLEFLLAELHRAHRTSRRYEEEGDGVWVPLGVANVAQDAEQNGLTLRGRGDDEGLGVHRIEDHQDLAGLDRIHLVRRLDVAGAGRFRVLLDRYLDDTSGDVRGGHIATAAGAGGGEDEEHRDENSCEHGRLLLSVV